MHPIDQVELNFSGAVPVVIAVVTAFLIFGVSLDLRVSHFRRIILSPRAPLIGLVAQFVVLPAVAFAVSSFVAEAPSVALGLILAASCPGGSGSNFLTGLARGDVATSVTMTSVSTVAGIVLTPLVFAFWVSLDADTAALLRTIELDGTKIVIVLIVMLLLPVAGGMLVRARRSALADRIRTPVRRASVALFLMIVLGVVGSNITLLTNYRGTLIPVALTFAGAMGLGWLLARAAALNAADRRAVTLEVGVQNVGIAIPTILVFFPALAGALLACLFWGILQIIGGFILALGWSTRPPEPAQDLGQRGSRRRP